MRITGEQDWQQKSYTVSSGIHTLKWVYDDGRGSSGDNCGWVDFVQWSGPSPQQDPTNFQTINYKHDLYGRRSEKKVDGFSTRYLYDGGQVIAEYDGNNNLLRKYIYGPGIDQPVCMIEEAESETYYYHFDALGSVVALSDSAGDTVQTYEYSVYGQVAVEDINHTNPYMFAGRRFDIEIGLYYNRARYYNPYTGRFLQADPIGYGDGMNMYAYCGNSPVGRADPSGLAVDWTWYGFFGFLDLDDPKTIKSARGFARLIFQYWDENGELAYEDFDDLEDWEAWARVYFEGRENEMAGSTLAGDSHELFWELQKMSFLCRDVAVMLSAIDELLENTGQKVKIQPTIRGDWYNWGSNTLYWHYKSRGDIDYFPKTDREWHTAPDLVGLAHELQHCWDDLKGKPYLGYSSEVDAMKMENKMRYGFFKKVPGKDWIYPRPSYAEGTEDLGSSPTNAWDYYFRYHTFTE